MQWLLSMFDNKTVLSESMLTFNPQNKPSGYNAMYDWCFYIFLLPWPPLDPWRVVLLEPKLLAADPFSFASCAVGPPCFGTCLCSTHHRCLRSGEFGGLLVRSSKPSWTILASWPCIAMAIALASALLRGQSHQGLELMFGWWYESKIVSLYIVTYMFTILEMNVCINTCFWFVEVNELFSFHFIGTTWKDFLSQLDFFLALDTRVWSTKVLTS